MRIKIIVAALLFLNICSFAQKEVDIVPQLQLIEGGEIDKAKEALQTLKAKSPKDPSVLFLDAVLTENGNDAYNKYSNIYYNHPTSKYADAALYRMYSYHYSLGYYRKAESLIEKLKTEYPNSPYIKSTETNIQSAETETETVQTPPVVYAKFTIQAGAFHDMANANQLKKQFETDGYYSTIYAKTVGGTMLNIVTFGQFQSKDDASNMLSLLQLKYSIKGYVVPIN
ncbi:MAG: SPOR domain-containing protein [bacterium]